jgi:AbrB family looped-hinge helix DNA binding protein
MLLQNYHREILAGTIRDNNMETVPVSSIFQVVIPQEVRESMGLRPGTTLQIFQYENRLELIPLRNPKSLRGFLQGIQTGVPRAED